VQINNIRALNHDEVVHPVPRRKGQANYGAVFRTKGSHCTSQAARCGKTKMHD
jgi:hypothetical protein